MANRPFVLNGFSRANSCAFCNFLKTSVSNQFGATTSPADLNNAGFPISTPAANIGLVCKLPAGLRGPYVLKAPSGSGTGGFAISNALTISEVGGTVNSITYGDGGQTTGSKASISITGKSLWRIVFTLNADPPAGGLTIYFPNSGTYSSMSGLVLCRLSDEDAVDANPNAFTSEFKSVISGTGCTIIRPMHWTCRGTDFTAVSQAAYRWPTDAFSFFAGRHPPAAWVGTISGTDTYSCGDTATPSLSSWVDGLTWQGRFTNTNTVTTPTIAPNGLSAKTLVRMQDVGPLLVGGVNAAAGNTATFIYSELLDKVIYQDGGMIYGPPVETKVDLCNELAVNLWHNFTFFHTLASVTTEADYIAANLNSSLECWAEYSNEVWLYPANAAQKLGQALGFTATSSRDYMGWYGLRTRQIMALARTSFASRPDSLKTIIAFQAAAASPANHATYMWKGADLAPSGVGTGQGNSTYSTFTGSADYTTSPNRPIDYCDYVSYATYYEGAQAAGADANYTSNGSANEADLKTAADDYDSGNPASMAAALAWLDNDVRQGTLASSGANGGATLKAADTLLGGLGMYPRWQAQLTANSFSQKVVCYEGGLGFNYPSTATANTVFGSTTYGGAGGLIDNLLVAYRNSNYAQQVALDQYKQFMGEFPSSANYGALPNSYAPSWFILDDATQWSHYPGDIITSTRYQTYDADALYTTRKRRLVVRT